MTQTVLDNSTQLNHNQHGGLLLRTKSCTEMNELQLNLTQSSTLELPWLRCSTLTTCNLHRWLPTQGTSTVRSHSAIHMKTDVNTSIHRCSHWSSTSIVSQSRSSSLHGRTPSVATTSTCRLALSPSPSHLKEKPVSQSLVILSWDSLPRLSTTPITQFSSQRVQTLQCRPSQRISEHGSGYQSACLDLSA